MQIAPVPQPVHEAEDHNCTGHVKGVTLANHSGLQLGQCHIGAESHTFKLDVRTVWSHTLEFGLLQNSVIVYYLKVVNKITRIN